MLYVALGEGNLTVFSLVICQTMGRILENENGSPVPLKVISPNLHLPLHTQTPSRKV